MCSSYSAEPTQPPRIKAEFTDLDVVNVRLNYSCWRSSLSRLMSCFRHDRLEGWDHSILINRLDTSWSLSLCPLYMTPNLGCATSCLISHFVALRLTVSGSDWGDPLGISLRKACLMDETSSHLQSLLTTPVSSLSHRQTHTPCTLLLTYSNLLVLYCGRVRDRRRDTLKVENLYRLISSDGSVEIVAKNTINNKLFKVMRHFKFKKLPDWKLKKKKNCNH